MGKEAHQAPAVTYIELTILSSSNYFQKGLSEGGWRDCGILKTRSTRFDSAPVHKHPGVYYEIPART